MGKFKYIEEQEYKYKSIPEKGIVICECYVQLNWTDLPHSLWPYIDLDELKKYNKNLCQAFPKFKIRAVAKTHPNDTFNEETGKRIAKSKVNIKLYKTIEKCLKLFRKGLYKKVSINRYAIEDIYILKQRELSHLMQLSK